MLDKGERYHVALAVISLMAVQPSAASPSKLAVHTETSAGTREQFVADLFRSFRAVAKDDSVLDRGDIDAAEKMAKASARAQYLTPIFSRDLDSDRVVTREEFEHARPRLIHNIVAADSLQSVFDEMDTNLDGKLTLDEVISYTPRANLDIGGLQVRRAVELLERDPNGDGRLTVDETEALARAEFASFDLNGNSIIDPDEQRLRADRQRAMQQKAMEQRKAKSCGFPNIPETAKVIFISGYEGGALSNVSTAGQNKVTEAVGVVVAPGTCPLIILATSYAPMIWQFKGAVERIGHFAVVSPRSGVQGQPGVTGLPRSRVSFLARRDCLPLVIEDEKGEKARAENMIEAIAPERHSEIVSQYTLGQQDGPRTRDVEIRLPSARDRGVEYADKAPADALLRFSPGGLTSIDPDQVISNGRVERYAVLPQEAGLLQLISEGSLVREDGDYRIVKPIAQFPPGLAGAHAVRFILSRGLPEPEGAPGHSKVYSEDRGDWLSTWSLRTKPTE